MVGVISQLRGAGGVAIIQKASTAGASGAFATALPVLDGALGRWQAEIAPNATRPMVLRARRSMVVNLLSEVTHDAVSWRLPAFASSRVLRLRPVTAYSREIAALGVEDRNRRE
jgi:hypothetical protein